MTGILLRKAERSDLPAIQRLLSTYFLDIEELKTEDFLLSEGEKKVLGCAALIQCCSSEKGFLEIHSIAVHPNFRGKGIGSRLVNHLISTLGQDAELYVKTTAPGFFEKLGFVRIPDSEKLRIWEDCAGCEHFGNCSQHSLKYRKNQTLGIMQPKKAFKNIY